MDDFENNVKFGIFESYSHYFGPHSIGCVFPINKAEMVAITMKETILFEGDEIKARARYNFCTGCYIPEVTLIVAHTYRGSELFAMQINDLGNPILSNFPTDQVGVYHMIYSPKSHVILTIGTGVKVWNVSWVDLGKKMFTTNSKVIITLRSTFALTYDSPMLNPPDFDYETERLYLPTPEGIRGFNLDGFPCDLITLLPADTSTIYSFCPHNRKVVTSDPVNGVCVWKKGGEMEKRITTLGPTILSIGFIDPQNILYLNASGSLFLINLKASRPFHCYDSQQMPTRLSIVKLYNRPHIAFCVRSEFRLLRVVIPWKVWNLNISQPKLITRTPKYNCAAQIITQTNNSFIKIYSPQTRRPLVSTTPGEATTPHSFFYDRGTFIEYKYDELSLSYSEQAYQTTDNEPRDYLFVTFDNGIIVNYDMSCVPCNEIWSSKMNALCVEMIKSPNTDSWLYAIGRSDGGLSLLDYFTFKEIRTVSVCKEKIVGMIYHYHSNSIIFVLENKLQMLDLKTYQIIDTIRYQYTEIFSMHGSTIYLGGKNGEIERYEILNRHFVKGKLDVETKPHSERVTSFAFGKKYYLSASIDTTFMLWNYEHDKITLVTVPFPIYSISFLGPRREILLGMDNEVMIMDPTILFGDEVDPEIEVIDNYDRKDDVLDPELLAMKAIQEEQKKRQLINSLFANTIAPETKRPRNFFKKALLKYQQEQALLQQKGQQLFEKGGSADTPGDNRNNQFGGMNSLIGDKDKDKADNSKPSQSTNNQKPNNDSNKDNSKPSSPNRVKRKKVKKENNDENKKDNDKADPEKALNLLNQMGSKDNQDAKKSTGKKPEVDISKMSFASNAENNKNQQDNPQSKQKSNENKEDDSENEDGEGEGDEENEKGKKKSKSKGKSSPSKQQKSKQNDKSKDKQKDNEKQKQKEAEKAKENEKQKQKENDKQKQKDKENDKEKKNAAKSKENNENSSPNKKADKTQKKQPSPPPASTSASKQKSSSNSPSSKPQQETKNNNNNKSNPQNQEANPTATTTNNLNNNTTKPNTTSNNINNNTKQPNSTSSNNNNSNNPNQLNSGNINTTTTKQPNSATNIANNNNNSNQPNIANTTGNNSNNNSATKQPNINSTSNNNNIDNINNIKQPNSNNNNNNNNNNNDNKEKDNNLTNSSQPTSITNKDNNNNDNNKIDDISKDNTTTNDENKTPESNSNNNEKNDDIKQIIDNPPNPAIVDEKGNVLMNLSINSEGKVVNDKGEVLENIFVDKDGNLVNEKGEYVNERGEPISPPDKIKYVSIASQYDYVTEDGQPIPSEEIEKEIQKQLQVDVEMDRVTSDKAKEQIKDFHDAYSIKNSPDEKMSEKQKEKDDEEKDNENEEKDNDNENNDNDNEDDDKGANEKENNLTDDSPKTIKMMNSKQEIERPSTPPPVRWHAFDDKNDQNPLNFEPNNNSKSRRSRTPPLKRKWKRWQKEDDHLPPPNIVLDPEAVLSMFGRGHTELLPLVERIRRDYVAYQTHIAPLPIVFKQGKSFRLMRPDFDTSGPNAKFLLFPENKYKDNYNTSYSNFNSDSYNRYNYQNFQASMKTFKPKVYKAVSKTPKEEDEPKNNDTKPKVNFQIISLDPVNLTIEPKQPPTVHFNKHEDEDDNAVSFGPRPPSDRQSFTYSPHRRIPKLNRDVYTTENQRGFQVKPLNVNKNSEKEDDEKEDEDDVSHFIINQPKSARRQRSPYQEYNTFDKKPTEEEIKRPNSLRTNRNNGFDEINTPKYKSSDDKNIEDDKNISDSYNPTTKSPKLRQATIKDYTFLLDTHAVPTTSTSTNKMSTTLRDMFPMTTKGPIINENPNINKSLYKGGGYFVGGIMPGSGISPADFSKSYSMKLTRPSVKKKNSPNLSRKRNALNSYWMQPDNEV